MTMAKRPTKGRATRAASRMLTIQVAPRMATGLRKRSATRWRPLRTASMETGRRMCPLHKRCTAYPARSAERMITKENRSLAMTIYACSSGEKPRQRLIHSLLRRPQLKHDACSGDANRAGRYPAGSFGFMNWLPGVSVGYELNGPNHLPCRVHFLHEQDQD